MDDINKENLINFPCPNLNGKYVNINDCSQCYFGYRNCDTYRTMIIEQDNIDKEEKEEKEE